MCSNGFCQTHLRISIYEIVFTLYAMGWVLDEIASIFEHGWYVNLMVSSPRWL